MWSALTSSTHSSRWLLAAMLWEDSVSVNTSMPSGSTPWTIRRLASSIMHSFKILWMVWIISRHHSCLGVQLIRDRPICLVEVVNRVDRTMEWIGTSLVAASFWMVSGGRAVEPVATVLTAYQLEHSPSYSKPTRGPSNSRIKTRAACPSSRTLTNLRATC